MPADNTQTIARNSFWYGIELLFSLLGALIAPIVVARAIGPERLGYFSYMVWLTNITATVGALGLPLTARKYMAEYLNRGESGVARSIYQATLRLQLWIAAAVSAAALLLVLAFGDPGQRLISVLLVMNMAPRTIGFVPSQANNAAESMRRNTGASLLGGLFTVGLTLFALWAGWDLPGVAAATVAGPALETVLKLRSVERWLGGVTPAAIPADLRRQMFVYSGQGLALMLLNVVVWDRSDMVFLKWLNADLRQLTFFSTAFNLTERVLQIPNAFGNAVGITMMAQYGRGEEKLRVLAVDGARYAFLIALPLLAGTACVSGPAILLLYGERFRPMIPVLTAVTLLAIPKALAASPTLLLQTTRNQGFLVVWGCVCGAIDVALDILLTPHYGALGAAIANGTAQTAGAVGVWWWVYRLFRPDLRLAAFGKIAIAGLGMAAAATIAGWAIPTYAGVAASILAGALVWFALLRGTGALDATDAQRFRNVGRVLPGRLRPAWDGLVGMIARQS
jgi:O-antigen/teichoic acid export membrane protein